MDLTGSLVRLRAPRPEDAEPMACALADPDVVAGIGPWAHGPYGVDDARRWIDDDHPGSVTWAIEETAGGAFVGVTGLDRIDHRNRNCWWGIWIGPSSYWGRGLGTEVCGLATGYAFRHLGVEKVCLYVYETNPRARAVYERCGYVLEGTLPRHTLVAGRLVTCYIMAAFRDNPLYAG
jgi:RimJ/RimL family protein N-acetyltransferase